MADLAVQEVVVPATKWTLTKIWHGLGYVLCYKRNIRDLDKQVQQLCRKRKGVDLKVKAARDDLKVIDPGVDHWLGEVDKIIERKKASFSQETVAARAVCCSGWLPNLKGRFSLGRKSKKMALEVDNLLAQGLGTIAHSARPEVEFPPTDYGTSQHFHQGARSSGTSNHERPPPAIEGGNIYFPSRGSTVEKVMEALRGNEVNPIILCGMGGIGKTTLMGQVFHKAKGEGLFDEHTKATFKESLDIAPPDLIPIQDELARFLGLSLQGTETDTRATVLRARLSQGNKKSTLVMLDNVSKTPPDFLWKIGINPSSCKILVTSRQQDLFKDMDTRKNFPIHGLPDLEAWSLFKKTAGSSIESDPELRVVAQKILKKCDGLPIAISTVGTALKGESIAIWKNALRELEKANPQNVPGVIKDVYGKIKFSYECLPSQQAKLLFLLCSWFDEGPRIPIKRLVRFGLGLFTSIDDSLADGRNRMEALVQTLKSRFLLLSDDDKPGYVRMHDVVHDVALYIASEEFVEKKNDSMAGKRIVVRRTTKSLNLLDCPKNIISECDSLCIDGRCELLFVQGNSAESELEPAPTIFNKMAEDLKVLFMVYMPLSSLGVLKNLHTLRLYCSECDVSLIGQLVSLVMLDLSECHFIKQLPDTFRNLANLRYLNLNGCGKLEVISPGVISSLTRLEELYMLGSFNSWDWVVEKLASAETANWISRLEADERQVEYRETRLEMWKSLHMLAVEQPDNVRDEFREEVQRCVDGAYTHEFTRWADSMDWKTGILAELLSLSCLTTLEVVLPPVNEVLTSTTLFNKLETFKIFIGWNEHINWRIEYEGNLLKLEDVDASAILGGGIGLLLGNTNSVDFKSVFVSQLPNVCFAKVKSMAVEKCDAVEYLIDTTLMKPITPGSCGVFPVLVSLTIKKASRLKEVVHGELPTGSLKKLRKLELSELPALTYAWKTKTQSESALGLVESLRIQECNSLEEIVAFEDDDKEEINFKSLKWLRLSSLPRFAGFTRNISNGSERLTQPQQTESEQSDVIIQSLLDNKLHFPVLECLDIEDLNIKEIWSRQVSAVSFSDLQTLYVAGCANLLHVVPTHMQIRLQKLKWLEVMNCCSLEEIFESRRLTVDDEGDAAAALTIYESANQGTQVNKMMSFAHSGQAFHNLTELIIQDIPRCISHHYLAWLG